MQSDTESIVESAKRLRWYHRIELVPGFITQGYAQKNGPIIRTLLQRIEVRGRNCLDIGTMDGTYAVLLCRQGARKVLATDRQDRSENIDLVRSSCAVNFEYAPRLRLGESNRVVKDLFGAPADVVLFCGVLYHMFDPMAGLATVRGLCRRGGIVLIDTPAIISDAPFLYFNRERKLYTYSTYFAPSLSALDGMLSMVGLQPIDCTHSLLGKIDGHSFCRLAVACRSTDFSILSDEHPAWVRPYTMLDLVEFISEELMSTEDDARVRYTEDGKGTVLGNDKTVDLYQLCKAQEPLKVILNELPLRLSDTV